MSRPPRSSSDECLDSLRPIRPSLRNATRWLSALGLSLYALCLPGAAAAQRPRPELLLTAFGAAAHTRTEWSGLQGGAGIGLSLSQCAFEACDLELSYIPTSDEAALPGGGTSDFAGSRTNFRIRFRFPVDDAGGTKWWRYIEWNVGTALSWTDATPEHSAEDEASLGLTLGAGWSPRTQWIAYGGRLSVFADARVDILASDPGAFEARFGVRWRGGR